MELDDQPIEAAHEFLVDLNRVVLINYRFALDQMALSEDQDTKHLEEELSQEDDFEVASARRTHLTGEFKQYRQTANQLALVGVVTRLHHWTGGLVERLTKQPSKQSLAKQLELLDHSLSPGPVPLEFFKDLTPLETPLCTLTRKPSGTFFARTGKSLLVI